MSSRSVLRITKEVTNLQKGPDLSLAVAFKDEDVRKVRALIIGPPDTPYEFGFFEFLVHFGKEYPNKEPTVKCLTTNGGRTRFNPNMYAEGKVCLSILGTWRGERGEEWSSAQSLESILISIQSLMSKNPYENEPGFEVQRKESEVADAAAYAAKIRHESLRISVIEKLEGYLGLERPAGSKEIGCKPATATHEYGDVFEPFADLCKRRFLWYYNDYLHNIAEQEKERSTTKEGSRFKLTPFECTSNGMDGIYQYQALTQRLKEIRWAIDRETDDWESAGLEALKRQSPGALLFQNKFQNVVRDYKRKDIHVDFELIDKNPLAWGLVLFGRPMTNLDGGIFKIKIVFSLDFPHEQPRVKLETPLFHHRVSPDGVLCYLVENAQEIESHITAIIEAIEEENPPYDPRTLVNVEASKLRWGSADDRKIYNRKLRRSAQSTSE